MADGSAFVEDGAGDMTHPYPSWLRAVRVVCSDQLWADVADPALADLAYERNQSPPMDCRRVCIGYWRIVLAVVIALPGDVLLHRLSAATLLRIVTAVAFPGLTPSFGFSTTSLRHRRQEEEETGEQ